MKRRQYWQLTIMLLLLTIIGIKPKHGKAAWSREVILPVTATVSDATGIDMNIRLNPEFVETAEATQKSEALMEAMLAGNQTGDKLKVGIASSSPVTQEGTLFYLKLTLKKAYTQEDELFKVLQVKVNETTVYRAENSILVSGVRENGSYKEQVTIGFNEGTATLNGNPIGNHTTVWEPGNYTLRITDLNGKVREITFSITGETIAEHTYAQEFTIDRSPTCTTAGEKSRHCTKEGCWERTEITSILATGHHWDGGQVTRWPTCTWEGSKTFTCNACKETRTESLPAIGHDFDKGWTEDKKAGCTQQGEKSRHCTREGCWERTEITAIPATGHHWDNGKVTKSPTCTQKGSKTFTCSSCHQTRMETISAKGHSYTKKVVKPTYKEKGYTEYRCKDCGHTYKSNYTPQLKLTLKFNSNGGNAPSKQSISFLYGNKYGTLPKVTRKGYTFSGWYTAKTGGSKVTSATVGKKSSTVYARWTKVTVSKGTIQKLSTTPKKLTVSIKKVSGAKGYEIRYSTKSNMKSAVTKSTSNTTLTISKLKSKTTYYVQVRAYKTDSMGKKVYGSWSSSKKLKVK